MKQLNIKIHGRVKNVFFRLGAKEKACELGLFGRARHLPDGSLHIRAEGETENLKKFLYWCRRGPLPAKVDKVEAMFSPELENMEDFFVE